MKIRIISLCLILFSIFTTNISECAYVDLCGKSLEIEFAKKIRASNKIFTASEIINFAKMAINKNMLSISRQEQMALEIMQAAIAHLAQTIVIRSKTLKSNPINVVLFGGIIDGLNEYFKNLLNESIKKINHSRKKINLVYSNLHDERAILGSIIHAKSKSETLNQNNFAVGIDIGGTNIRVALINTLTFTTEGPISKESFFSNNKYRTQMRELGKNIKRYKVTSEKPNNLDLRFFLEKNNSLYIQESLEHKMIETIAQIIEKTINGKCIDFISIASAGKINKTGSYEYAYNLPFIGTTLKDAIESTFKVPVFIANDIYCAALGELNFGTLKGTSEFLIVGAGTGLGILSFNSERIQ